MVNEWAKSEKQFFDKVNAMSTILATWNKNSFGNVIKKKAIILSRIEGIQKSQGSNGFLFFSLILKNLCKGDLLDILHQEETFWMMKGREIWLL